jgi:hypothetical protein
MNILKFVLVALALAIPQAASADEFNLKGKKVIEMREWEDVMRDVATCPPVVHLWRVEDEGGQYRGALQREKDRYFYVVTKEEGGGEGVTLMRNDTGVINPQVACGGSGCVPPHCREVTLGIISGKATEKR